MRPLPQVRLNRPAQHVTAAECCQAQGSSCPWFLLQAEVADEIAKWTKVIKDANIRQE